jgi:hypothetical protein
MRSFQPVSASFVVAGEVVIMVGEGRGKQRLNRPGRPLVNQLAPLDQD